MYYLNPSRISHKTISYDQVSGRIIASIILKKSYQYLNWNAGHYIKNVYYSWNHGQIDKRRESLIYIWQQVGYTNFSMSFQLLYENSSPTMFLMIMYRAYHLRKNINVGWICYILGYILPVPVLEPRSRTFCPLAALNIWYKSARSVGFCHLVSPNTIWMDRVSLWFEHPPPQCPDRDPQSFPVLLQSFLDKSWSFMMICEMYEIKNVDIT